MVADADIDGGACVGFDVQNDAAFWVVGFAESTPANAPATELFQCVDFQYLAGGDLLPGNVSCFAMKR